MLGFVMQDNDCSFKAGVCPLCSIGVGDIKASNSHCEDFIEQLGNCQFDSVFLAQIEYAWHYWNFLGMVDPDVLPRPRW
jgi:hypothetical protein